jgi:hypothetical protein
MPSTPPPWLTAGRDFYRAAFEKRTRPGLDAAIDDWMHLAPEEHAFVQSHLLYLNLLAQADQLALLEDIRTQLAEGQLAQEELVVALMNARDDSEDLPDEAEDAYDGDDDGFYDEPHEDGDFEEGFTDDFDAPDHEPEESPEEDIESAEPVVIDVAATVIDSRVVAP